MTFYLIVAYFVLLLSIDNAAAFHTSKSAFISRLSSSSIYKNQKHPVISSSLHSSIREGESKQYLTDDKGVAKVAFSSGDKNARRIEPGDILAVQYTAKIKDTNFIFAKGDQEKVVIIIKTARF